MSSTDIDAGDHWATALFVALAGADVCVIYRTNIAPLEARLKRILETSI